MMRLIEAYYGSKTDRLECFAALAADESMTAEVRAVAQLGLGERALTIEGRSETCERLLWLVDAEWARDAEVKRWT